VCSVFGSRVAWLLSQLYRGRLGTSARLGAFAAAQPAGEIVHEGGRRMLLAARLTSLGILQRAHLISSQG
jgi:hypothetical protein